MRRRCLNVDADSGERWTEFEGDDPPSQSAPLHLSGAAPQRAVPKRLFTDVEAAAYLTMSRSAVRALVANGDIKRVQLPSTDGQGRAARVLRIDRKDLDAFIERSKA
jgi:hypothetical protein